MINFNIGDLIFSNADCVDSTINNLWIGLILRVDSKHINIWCSDLGTIEFLTKDIEYKFKENI